MKKGERRSDEVMVSQLLNGGLNNLNNEIMDLSRREVAVLLFHELSHGKRDDFVRRLHQRLARLRTKDELKVIRKCKNPDAIDWLLREVAQTGN